MNLKAFFKAIVVKARLTLSGSKKFAKSYVSLFLVLLIGATSTIAWFTEQKAAELSSGNLKFESASSLRISKDDYAYSNFYIKNIMLDEASSVDGRNVYFPLGESFTEKTANMQFREANVGDENVRYVYTDLKLKGSHANTPVYIKSYKITIASDANGTISTAEGSVDGVYQDELVIVDSSGNPLSDNNTPYKQVLPPDNCPIRIAFIDDSSLDPVVIDPSAQSSSYVEDTHNAVALIDDDGYPVARDGLLDKHVDSFASHYFGTDNPLFIIPGGQEKIATMVAWLEGSFDNSDAYIGKYISIDIDIESNFADMETITFIDETTGDTDNNEHYWVSNDDPTMALSYKDPYSQEGRYKTVIMTRMSEDSSSDDYRKWTAKIPKSALDYISFYRLAKAADREDKNEPHGTIYNSWHTRPGVNDMLKSDINTSWFYPTGSKNLQETRRLLDTLNNVHYNATVYTAIRGNGYGPTDVSNERLAPCIGYWSYTGPTASGEQAETPSTPSGGDSSSTTYTVIVSFSTNPLNYIYTASGTKLYFHTGSGEEYEVDRAGSNYFTKQFPALKANDTIDYFYLMYSSGFTEKYSLISKYTITNRNVSFYFSDSTNKILSWS